MKEFKERADRLTQFMQEHPKGKRLSYINHLDLLEAYLDVKEKVGRVPRTEDIRVQCRYSLNSYRNHFGSYREFLAIVGDEKEWIEQHLEDGSSAVAVSTARRKEPIVTIPQPTVWEFAREIVRLGEKIGRSPSKAETVAALQGKYHEVLAQIVDLDKFIATVSVSVTGEAKEREKSQIEQSRPEQGENHSLS